MEFFLKSKDEQYDVLINFIKKLKRKGVSVSNVIFVKKLRMDNAGENKKFNKILESENLDIDVEFTPVDSPKYNAVVERGFGTLYGRVRATLNGASFFGKTRYENWAEVANTCTLLDDILAYRRGVPVNFLTLK